MLFHHSNCAVNSYFGGFVDFYTVLAKNMLKPGFWWFSPVRCIIRQYDFTAKIPTRQQKVHIISPDCPYWWDWAIDPKPPGRLASWYMGGYTGLIEWEFKQRGKVHAKGVKTRTFLGWFSTIQTG